MASLSELGQIAFAHVCEFGRRVAGRLRLDRAAASVAGPTSGARRSGILIAVAIIAIAGLSIWLSARAAAARLGDSDFDVTLICAACGHQQRESAEHLIALSNAARAKGFGQVGVDMTSPIGLCEKCGKPALYRAVACPKCGALMPPRSARVDGAPSKIGCPKCGLDKQH